MKIRNITNRNYTSFFWLLSGWVFSRVILSYFRGISIGSFILLPGFLMSLFLPFIVTWRYFTGANRSNIELFLSGTVADALFYWIIRDGTDAKISISGLWDPFLILCSVTTIILLIFLYMLDNKRTENNEHVKRSCQRFLPWLLGILFLGIVIAFRASYLFTRHIPNEERSLFLAGCEIHHAVLGMIVLTVLGIVQTTQYRWLNIILCIFASAAAGFVLDQSLFFMHLELSDQAYNSAISWFGALSGSIIFLFFIKTLTRSIGSRIGKQ